MSPRGTAALGVLLTLLAFDATAKTTIAGKVQFEKLPLGAAGLDFRPANRKRVPVVGAPVEIVAAGTERVLQTATTGADGGYEAKFDLNTATNLVVRVVAKSDNVEVVDFSTPPRTYSVASDSFAVSPNTSVTRNVLSLADNNGAAPFNILFLIRRVNSFVRALSGVKVNFPHVSVKWSPSYSGGTQFDSNTNTAYINGLATKDTDEFDDPVLGHEYGHFIASAFSRNDSPGGEHTRYERLDPRLAWGEGWATYFGCVTLGTPLYRDSGIRADTQKHGLIVDQNIEDHTISNAGYWNEHSVAALLWDISDTRNDAADTISVEFKKLWAALATLTLERYVYLGDYLDILSRASTKTITDGIQAISADSAIDYRADRTPTVSPRFPAVLAFGNSAAGEIDSVTAAESNRYTSSAFYEIVVSQDSIATLELETTASADKSSPKRADLDLYLYHPDNDPPLAEASKVTGVGDVEKIVERLAPGTYVVEVRGWYYKKNVLYPQRAEFKLTAKRSTP